MNSYELSRSWFDFSFENPDKIKPIHTAIYFFAIEHCNRLGWKKKFGFPTIMAMEAIGMKSYGTYKKHLDEIVSFGFIKVHEYSKNQHSSNVIELTLNDKASTKALDKALSKHGSKQHQSTGESTGSIDKPLTLEPKTNKQGTSIPQIEDVIAYFKENKYTEASARKAFDYYKASITDEKPYWSDGKGNPIKNWKMKMQSVWFKDENKETEKPAFEDRNNYNGNIRFASPIL